MRPFCRRKRASLVSSYRRSCKSPLRCVSSQLKAPAELSTVFYSDGVTGSSSVYKMDLFLYKNFYGVKKTGIFDRIIDEGSEKMVSYGTNGSIEKLVKTYSGMLLRLARSRLKNTMDAEDAVQEVFLYLIQHQMTFKNAEHEKAWLIRTTLHRAMDINKRASKAALRLEDACAAEAEEPKGVADALCSLPEKYAAVLYLYYYEGYSIKEIGTVLGLPSATVGTRLSRGRMLLERVLKEDL